MRAYTDYPFDFLGDVAGGEAPVRQVEVLYYDEDKRCKIVVEGFETEVKTGYLYTKPLRCEEAYEQRAIINTQYVKNCKGHYKSSKAAQITKSWTVYPANYKPGDGYKHYKNLNKAWRYACGLGIGSTVIQNLQIRYRDGSSTWTSGDIYYVVEE